MVNVRPVEQPDASLVYESREDMARRMGGTTRQSRPRSTWYQPPVEREPGSSIVNTAGRLIFGGIVAVLVVVALFRLLQGDAEGAKAMLLVTVIPGIFFLLTFVNRVA
jgi:hypothetical protein